LHLARHPAPKNPVSTGSIAILKRRVDASVIALWAPWEVAAAAAIFSLGNKSLRPNWSSVNPKPSSKYFVKLRRVNHAVPDSNCDCPLLQTS
jgi:hypothetical protein